VYVKIVVLKFNGFLAMNHDCFIEPLKFCGRRIAARDFQFTDGKDNAVHFDQRFDDVKEFFNFPNQGVTETI
jgi:hypothetical protein